MVPRGNSEAYRTHSAAEPLAAVAARVHGHPSLFAPKARDTPRARKGKLSTWQLPGLSRLLQQLSTNTMF